MWKKYILTCLSVVAGTLCAVSDTQKTELVLRDHRHRAAVFTTAHEMKIKDKKNFGARWQITGFYNETTDSSELGEVFGANGKNYVKVGTAAQVTAGTADVENNFLLHYSQNAAANTLEGTIKFNPERQAYGTNCDVLVRLDKILKGLYYKQNIILVNVKNDIGMKVESGKTGAKSTESHKLEDILGGTRLRRNIDNDPDESNDNIQEELRYAKIRGSESRTGLENIESILGWRFLEKKRYFVGINVALQSPSGDQPTGEFLWEPRLGNQHWGLGAGAEMGYTIWDSNSKTLKLLLDFHYRYLFEETEKRTLGIKNILTESKYSKHILSHYYLLAEVGQFTLIPAANVLTKDVDVEPGSQIDTYCALNFNANGFVFDIGYNLFWKERESVELKSNAWTDNKYGIADFDLETCSDLASFNITTDIQPNNKPINFANIDTSVAETPSILSHTIFGGVGHIWKKWKYPLMLGAGGSYEFGDDRAAADSWTLWLKGGFSF
jgi:hypothetical protein